MRQPPLGHVVTSMAILIGVASPLSADCPVDPGHVDLIIGQVDDQLVVVNGNALETTYLLDYVEPDDPNYDEHLRDKYVTPHPGTNLTTNPTYQLTEPYDLRMERVGFDLALYMYDFFGARVFQNDGDQEEVNVHSHFWFVIDPQDAPSRINACFRLVDLSGHYGDSDTFIIKFGTDCWCDGDVNYDNFVNVTDFTNFAEAYTAHIGEANYNSDADLDADGIINVTDFTNFAAGYNQPCD